MDNSSGSLTCFEAQAHLTHTPLGAKLTALAYWNLLIAYKTVNIPTQPHEVVP